MRKILTVLALGLAISSNAQAQTFYESAYQNTQRTVEFLEGYGLHQFTGMFYDRMDRLADGYAAHLYGRSAVDNTFALDNDVKHAWVQGYKGQDVNINVLDNFNSSRYMYVLNGWYNPLYIAQSHGERVSSVISGQHSHTDRGREFNWVGIAPEANVTNTNLQGNIRRHHIEPYDIVNVSLGSPNVVNIEDYAHRGYWVAGDVSNTLVVKSAGNRGLDCLVTCDPSTIQFRNGNLETLIVGALDHRGNIANYSNKAGALKDDFVVDWGTPVHVDHGSGTSFSAPLVSAKAAIIKSKFPELNAIQLADVIKTTATDLGAPGVDNVYGWGQVNLDRALSPIGGLR